MHSDEISTECLYCFSSMLEVTAFQGLSRVTSDCRPWPPGGRLGVCPECGLVQKPWDSVFGQDVDEIYTTYTPHSQGGE